MKIAICNIALRPKPDPFPPIACTSLYNALSEAGYDPIFYDIDAKRPSREELSEFFKKERFDVVGISAVVATGYRYTKNLADVIKEASPGTWVILGGNLAASYEVILRKCKIDICVIGKGEKPLLKLIEHLRSAGNFEPTAELAQIKGIAFRNAGGECRFTGCDNPDGAFTQQADYKVLEKFSDINHYIRDPGTEYGFVHDKRTHQLHRAGKKMAIIFTSKGCVNRCTFCHRWIGGYKIFSPEAIAGTIKFLIERYNVGFFCIGDECFGESAEWLENFITMIKPLDILFQVAGIRVGVVKKDPTILRRLKEAGLTALYFGMESGSNKMLSIMEKNANRADNIFAAKVCADEGLYTVIQLVIGMPGENDRTINETIDFVKKANANNITSTLSVNYLQALPGTPCYDFLRYHGMLGSTIDDEEKYLLKVADMNAGDFRQYTNVSEEDMASAKLWGQKLSLLTEINWLKHHKWKFPAARNMKSPKLRILVYRIIDAAGDLFWALLLLRNRILIYGSRKALLMSLGVIKKEDRSKFKIEARSLRKIMAEKKQSEPEKFAYR